MKILMIVPRFYPDIGGVEKHTLYLARELVKNNHEVSIITLSSCNYPEYEVFEGIKIFRIRMIKFNRLRVAKWITKNFKIFRHSDIIHCHDYSTFVNIYFPLRFILPNKKVFITFHGWEGMFPPSRKTIFVRKVVEKLTYGNICIGHFIEKWYGAKADYVSYGATELNTATSSIEEDKIIYIGRLEADAGIMEYFQALVVLKTKYKTIKPIEICGDGSLMDDLIEFAKDNDLDVTFHGFVDKPEDFLENSRYCLTSGYLAILEAMAHKKIVIATYDNQLKEDYLKMIPEYDEMIIVSNNYNDLAKKMHEIIKDDKLRNKMIKKSYKWVKTKSWNNLMNEYIRLWEKI